MYEDRNPYAPLEPMRVATAAPPAAAEPINPWVSIWTRPRATVQWIVDTDPGYMVLALAAGSGVLQVIDGASARSQGDRISLGALLMLALIFGPLRGIITLYLSGFLLGVTGRWIGGRASGAELRAAIAWGQAPYLLTAPLWAALILLVGQEMFSAETPRLDSSPGLLLIAGVLGLLSVVLSLWAFVATLKCVGQVQGFSAWKALGNVLLSFLVLAVPIAALIVGGAVLLNS